MTARDVESAGDGMRCAMDLFELGLEIQRQNLRREFAGATEDEIEQHLAAWLLVRRGAERGDAEGRACARDFGSR